MRDPIVYERLVDITELCRLLGVSRRTVERWRKAGRFRRGIYRAPGRGRCWVRYSVKEIREQLGQDRVRGRL